MRTGVERMKWMSCPKGVKAAERQSTECETLLNRWQAPVRARSLRKASPPDPRARKGATSIAAAETYMKSVSLK